MYRKTRQTWNDVERETYQSRRFEKLVAILRQGNAFYRAKWAGLSAEALDYGQLGCLPLTTKQELLADQAANPPFGGNLTQAPVDYLRFHQTSGTTGNPLRVLDTRESWAWWSECWQYILDGAGVTPQDRVMLAFSFGPFIGFWACQEAVQQLGALVLPGGGMSTEQRLELMRSLGATVLVCTPSYALHLAEVARGLNLDPATLPVRVTLHAGEPGAGIPATRERIESDWGASTFDHPGASEVGAFGFSCSARAGVHIIEAEFIAEVIDPDTGLPCATGEEGELVLTNLGRSAFPVVRYRTGDIVKARQRGTCECGRTTLFLEGGILGRRDDMVVIRGVNVFPAAIWEIFNTLPDVGEHRITAYREGTMDQIHIEYEQLGWEDSRESVARTIRGRLGIRVSIQALPPESLPRFDLKAKRFFDRRDEGWRPDTEGFSTSGDIVA